MVCPQRCRDSPGSSRSSWKQKNLKIKYRWDQVLDSADSRSANRGREEGGNTLTSLVHVVIFLVL
eukprot:767561-Hanusia_phi.AAC.6